MRRTVCLGLGLLPLAASPALAAAHTITVNTVQIFGTIDPAKISDYTDYMAVGEPLRRPRQRRSERQSRSRTRDELGRLARRRASVTFHLRPDAKFQDGSPVTADDVVYSVERLLKINQGPANLFAGVLKPGSVVAVDATDGQVHAREDLLAVPGDRAGDPHRQFEARQGQRGQPTTARPISRPMSPAPAPIR